MGAGCDNVGVPTSTDGWYPRSFVLTDIVDSVSLWERDAELMSRAVARHDAMISREVEAAGGTLVRSKGEGDSTFSVFAHPADAVVAAVAIQGAVAAERWPTAVPLRVRAGVHTGDAEPRDGDWYGPAVNRAARLRARADGGQTLLSGVTAGLVAEQLPEDVGLLYRGRRVLRGIERPEEVWELVAADDPRLAVPRLAKLRGLPLAGPASWGGRWSLRLLDELLGEARAGEPVTVLICGEAGAGKTRLVTEMAAVARDGGTRTVAGNCTVVGRTALAFAPFAEVLRTVVQELAIDEGSGAGRVAPRLARLVAGPGGGTASRDPPGPGRLGASAQLGLFEEVLDALESAAVPSGLLVVIEDLHWADPSSRGLFEFLSRNLRGAAVALVGTVRTDEPDNAGFLAWLAEIQRAPRAIRVDLEPFGRDELADLLAGVLGQPPSAELAGQVYERSGGNAFLAEELVAAGERGVLVPATVRSLVVARMAGLTAPARALVRLAAVAGVGVGHGLLAAPATSVTTCCSPRRGSWPRTTCWWPTGRVTGTRSGTRSPGRPSTTTCCRVSDRASTGRSPRRSPTSRRWDNRLGGRSPKPWPSTGSRQANSSTPWLPRLPLGTPLSRCSPSPARLATTSGHWPCGTGWPTPRQSPASDDPSCSNVQPTRQRGRRARSRHPLRRCRHRRAGARTRRVGAGRAAVRA